MHGSERIIPVVDIPKQTSRQGGRIIDNQDSIYSCSCMGETMSSCGTCSWNCVNQGDSCGSWGCGTCSGGPDTSPGYPPVAPKPPDDMRKIPGPDDKARALIRRGGLLNKRSFINNLGLNKIY